MPSPTKVKRNEGLVRKRMKDHKEWSFGKLADFYRIDKKTARDIFNRDVNKYFSRKEIKIYRDIMEKKKRGELSTGKD